MKAYAEKKKAVQVEQGNLLLYKTTSNLFRARRSGRLDLRHFNQVISVDQEGLTADVEGLTTYETLVNETLKYSCLPTVVPELKTITIGGAVAGCGIESSSFRYGLVHETVLEMDILLADGKIVTCTADNEHRELFFAFPNSYGTLGYALRVRVKLVPAKPFVKLTHRRFHDFTVFEEQKSDFLDGVIFDHNERYVTTGEFVDKAPYTSNYRYRKIYYRSIQERQEDYLTTVDYIWRWDPDWFWCSKVFLLQNPIIRLIFGKWMLNSAMYNRLRRLFPFKSKKKEAVIQDALIPIEAASQFLEFFEREIGIKPIWICPARPGRRQYTLFPLDPKTLYLDFGFWGAIRSNHGEGYYNRKIEGMVKELGGIKSLYSSCFYREKEFWEIYDQTHYLKLKAQYDPECRLNNLFEKCTT